MKEINLIPSEAASIIRTCTQAFFDDHEIPLNIMASQNNDEKTTCRDAVSELSTRLQEELCSNPLVLVKEKNPFTLGKTMFNPAIEQMGCDVASALLTQPFTLIQKEACNLTQTTSTPNKIVSVIEFIGQRCQVTVSMTTRQKIVACYPTYNVSATEETIQQDLNETTEQCQQVMQALPYSEKLKLCDAIDSALVKEIPQEKILQLIDFSKKNNPVSSSTTTQTPEEKQTQQKKIIISVDKIFIGERIIERTACENLQRAEFPLEKNKPLFIQIERACFPPYAFPLSTKRPQIAVDDSYFEQCQSFVRSLPTKDKQYLCAADLRTTFAQYCRSPFFTKTSYDILVGCQDTIQPAEENLAPVLQEIAAANSRRGLIGDDSSQHERISRNPILSAFALKEDHSINQILPAFVLKEDHSINQLSGRHALPALNNPENGAPNSSVTHTAIPATLTVIGSVGLLAAGVATYFFKSSFGRAKSDVQNDPQNDPLYTQETSSSPDVYTPKV
ncbi:hypothetical protein [Rickettsiella massiliensis]|uniref:hypothetical protein n=1 Tax=Rickettsiella massiliensis TaxID=676517 RepID=UPI00029AD43B|nr:hypothetical protein [Rickettsiella massiliensis]